MPTGARCAEPCRGGRGAAGPERVSDGGGGLDLGPGTEINAWNVEGDGDDAVALASATAFYEYAGPAAAPAAQAARPADSPEGSRQSKSAPGRLQASAGGRKERAVPPRGRAGPADWRSRRRLAPDDPASPPPAAVNPGARLMLAARCRLGTGGAGPRRRGGEFCVFGAPPANPPAAPPGSAAPKCTLRSFDDTPGGPERRRSRPHREDLSPPAPFPTPRPPGSSRRLPSPAAGRAGAAAAAEGLDAGPARGGDGGAGGRASAPWPPPSDSDPLSNVASPAPPPSGRPRQRAASRFRSARVFRRSRSASDLPGLLRGPSAASAAGCCAGHTPTAGRRAAAEPSPDPETKAPPGGGRPPDTPPKADRPPGVLSRMTAVAKEPERPPHVPCLPSLPCPSPLAARPYKNHGTAGRLANLRSTRFQNPRAQQHQHQHQHQQQLPARERAKVSVLAVKPRTAPTPQMQGGGPAAAAAQPDRLRTTPPAASVPRPRRPAATVARLPLDPRPGRNSWRPDDGTGVGSTANERLSLLFLQCPPVQSIVPMRPLCVGTL